jgi:hypothetical protein
MIGVSARGGALGVGSVGGTGKFNPPSKIDQQAVMKLSGIVAAASNSRLSGI